MKIGKFPHEKQLQQKPAPWAPPLHRGLENLIINSLVVKTCYEFSVIVGHTKEEMLIVMVSTLADENQLHREADIRRRQTEPFAVFKMIPLDD